MSGVQSLKAHLGEEKLKVLNLFISPSFYIVTCAFASYISYKSPFWYEDFSIYSFQNCANSHLLWRIVIMIHLYIYLGTTRREN